jgi:NAD(P) transhydrogenase
MALEKPGLAINDKGCLAVDQNYWTSVPHIYAAGEVIGFPALASTSMEQGRVAVCHALGLNTNSVWPRFSPWAFTAFRRFPQRARRRNPAKKINYCVGRAHYENNARGHFTGDTAGMLKLIFAPDDRKLLGVSLIGESATELIHIGMMVLDNGLTIDEFIEQVFNYPTLSETYKYAAYDGLGNLSGHKLREGQSPVAAADLGVAHHPVLASKPMRRILHATRTN